MIFARSKKLTTLRERQEYLKGELPHADEILCDFCEALLALVHAEVGPVFELLIDLSQRLVVVSRQLDLFPQVGWAVCALDRLDVQEAVAVVFVDGGILRVCKGARLAVAQARDIVLIAAEVLCIIVELRLKRAELLVDDLPDHLVALHGVTFSCCFLERPAPTSPAHVTKCREITRQGFTYLKHLFWVDLN